jgi:hypothetical protein
MTRQVANGLADRGNRRPREPAGQVAVRSRLTKKLQEVDRKWRDHEPAIRHRLVQNQLVVAPVQNGMPDSDVTVALTLQGSPRRYFAGVAVSSFGSDRIAMRPCAVNSWLRVGSGRTLTIAVNAWTSFGSELLQL